MTRPTTLRRSSGVVRLAVGLTTALVLFGILAALGGAAGARTSAVQDATPSNTQPPTITGRAATGQTLKADPGTWSNSPTSYGYQWQQCDATGNNCQNIAKATGQSYTIASGDAGKRIRVVVTAANSSGAAAAVSDPTDAVVALEAPPSYQSPPTISGLPYQGETLTTTNGVWQGSVATYTYQWQRCDANGNNCNNIAGAQDSTYTIQSSDINSRLRVVVTAATSGGAAAATSVPTKTITLGVTGAQTLPNNGGVSIPVTSVSLPARLIVDKVQFEPAKIASRQPFVARFHVVDTRGFSVRDALVYVVGVPAHRIAQVPEGRTLEDGWASFTLSPQAGLPLRRGALLTLFVRARKPGENILAGVSTRRLVSVHVNPG